MSQRPDSRNSGGAFPARVPLTDMMMPEMDGPTLVAALQLLDPKVSDVTRLCWTG